MEQILKTKITIPNWSFKNIDSDAYRKLEKSIHKNGQNKNIIVRATGNDTYEVIDGKIVFKILLDLPIDYVWCKVHRNISDLDARWLYLQLNYDFDSNYIEIAKTVLELSENHSKLEISKLVNLSVKEIKDLITLNDFDFERYKPIPLAEQTNFF